MNLFLVKEIYLPSYSCQCVNPVQFAKSLYEYHVELNCISRFLKHCFFSAVSCMLHIQFYAVECLGSRKTDVGGEVGALSPISLPVALQVTYEKNNNQSMGTHPPKKNTPLQLCQLPDFVRRGLCPEGVLSRGIMSEGVLSGGVLPSYEPDGA